MIENMKGVKSRPILMSEPRERGIDATHADINMASFFKKVFVREVAQVTKWEATSDIKPKLVNAEIEIDVDWKSRVGINPQLMMPGNYARVMFDKANESQLLRIIPLEERRQKMKQVLHIFRFMRSVYRSNDPMAISSVNVGIYKDRAVEMGKLLLEDFSYCQWPNYLHKIIEHVQEIIEDDTGVMSVGALSGEGNEAGNKIFRQFRKHHSRKGNTMQGLRDVLWLHWLYSSPKLTDMAEIYRKNVHCTQCHEVGHNIRTCTLRDKM